MVAQRSAPRAYVFPVYHYYYHHLFRLPAPAFLSFNSKPGLLIMIDSWFCFRYRADRFAVILCPSTSLES